MKRVQRGLSCEQSRISRLRVMVNGWRVWRRRGSLTAGGPAGVSGSTWGCGYWRGCRRSQQGKEAFLVPLGFIWLLAIQQGPSAHRHLKLNYSSVVYKWSVIHNSHQCTCITLILLYSKGFPVEFCSSKDGECLTGPADGDQHLPTESKRCNTGNQMTASPGTSTNMNETQP